MSPYARKKIARLTADLSGLKQELADAKEDLREAHGVCRLQAGLIEQLKRQLFTSSGLSSIPTIGRKPREGTRWATK